MQRWQEGFCDQRHKIRLTAGMPHAHFVRGPSPVTVLVGKASNKRAATGPGLRPVRQPARRYVAMSRIDMKIWQFLAGAMVLMTGTLSGQEVRDSAGVRIVENASPLWGESEGWRVSETPVVRIGAMDGAPELLFSRVASLVLGTNGDIIVADGGSGQIRTFDSNGGFRGSYGSPGEGPGEFMSLSWVGECLGGHLWAYDVRLGRVTEVGSAPPETWQLGGGAIGPPPRRVQCSEDGLVGMLQVPSAGIPNPGPMRGRARIEFFGSNLENVATKEVPGEDRYFLRGNLFPRPLGRRTVLAASGLSFALGTQDSPEVTFFDVRGVVQSVVRWSDTDLVIRDADIDAYVNGLIAAASPDRVAGIQAMYRDHEFPDHLPAFGRIILDEMGNLWVERTQRPGLPTNSWRVFSSAGVFLGSVGFPERFTPMFISSTRVGGVWRDDMDVEYVWVFDLIRSNPS